MSLLQILGALCACAGALLFLIGAIGLIRMPDPFTRLHALAKVDGIALGLISLGAGLHFGSWLLGAKLLLIWLLAIASAALIAHLIGASALRSGSPIWRRR